ncbi:Sua5/YciO/YrdC/YwlC family protein [Ammonifex degensii KC4]|uniref:Threonylcarbamoyl-AMP synthase n=1 Tax=Ammonifex degensii (strain DSM 10501 / KC4) TaxID=429009 RepID=C9RAD4_AMMDK|nr:L-threonylcarbamoyladenylate synthase [Ammonifex degensii]ACX51243.1 Sua5/YciO/YrdC/YwlC family protein [Ammonifex degensii KC4]
MFTKVWRVDPLRPESLALEEAGELLRRGELVAFPTETVYGLGAAATQDEALRRVFAVKGRPARKPLTLHLADPEEVFRYVKEVPSTARRLISSFWPGPLTLILPAASGLPPSLTAGGETVGIRVPDHAVAQELIRMAGLPLAAPSANLSGRPAPTKAAHVLAELGGKIAGVLDGGPTPLGIESTVVEVRGEELVVRRVGALLPEEIEERTGIKPLVAPAEGEGRWWLKAPLVLVEGEVPEQVVARVLAEASRQDRVGRRVGVLTREERVGLYQPFTALACGRVEDGPRSVAAAFYAALRDIEERVEIIVAEAVVAEVGKVVLLRLREMAAERYEAGRS